ncbi:hypothetical protein CDIK_1513 [Cucumispora dikerogammari]|nr:hypothetical protein CDIK_1513 [Cucumispora dikerogammari]
MVFEIITNYAGKIILCNIVDIMINEERRKERTPMSRGIFEQAKILYKVFQAIFPSWQVIFLSGQVIFPPWQVIFSSLQVIFSSCQVIFPSWQVIFSSLYFIFYFNST